MTEQLNMARTVRAPRLEVKRELTAMTPKTDAKIIELKHGVKIHGAEHVFSEVTTISPADATAWLQANCKNRPVRKRHVEFLANEIKNGNWQVNGQPIVIAENEQVLDGQHRLLAIIEAGIPIKSMVVYGIPEAAFATIDTGAVRTSADALCLHFQDYPQQVVKAVATAVPWVKQLERGSMHRGAKKISNTEVITYAKNHLSMFERGTTLLHYPKDNRPISIGLGTALYEYFARKDEEKADTFFEHVYTGENLERTDVEYVLRAAFQKDSQRVTSKLPAHVKARMCIKAWNWRRRGMTEATAHTISISATEDGKLWII